MVVMNSSRLSALRCFSWFRLRVGGAIKWGLGMDVGGVLASRGRGQGVRGEVSQSVAIHWLLQVLSAVQRLERRQWALVLLSDAALGVEVVGRGVVGGMPATPAA